LSAPCYSLSRHNTLLRKKEPSKNFSKILGDGASNYLLRPLEGFSSSLEEEKALECGGLKDLHNEIDRLKKLKDFHIFILNPKEVTHVATRNKTMFLTFS
jgi:hypothetical protein